MCIFSSRAPLLYYGPFSNALKEKNLALAIIKLLAFLECSDLEKEALFSLATAEEMNIFPLLNSFTSLPYQKFEEIVFPRIQKEVNAAALIVPILKAYRQNLNDLPDSFWSQLNQISQAGSLTGKPLQALLISLILNVDLKPNKERDLFLFALSKASHEPLSEFPNLAPDNITKWLYHLKAASLFKGINQDLSTSHVIDALELPFPHKKINDLKSLPLENILDFEHVLKKLSDQGQLETALKLVSYQGSLYGFSSIASTYAELLKNFPGRKELIDSVCLESLKKAGDLENKSWDFYKNLSPLPQVATFLEETFLKEGVDLKKLKGADKETYRTILQSRVQTHLIEGSLQPARDLLEYLAEISFERYKVSPLLKTLFDQSKSGEEKKKTVDFFNAKFPDLLEKFKEKEDLVFRHQLASSLAREGIYQKDQFLHLIQNLELFIKACPEKVLDVAKGYLLQAEPLEKAQLASASLLLHPSILGFPKEIFYEAVKEETDLYQAFQGASWTKEALQRGFSFLKDSKAPVEGFIKLALEKLPSYPASTQFLLEMLPFMSEEMKELLGSKAQEQMQLANSLEEVGKYLAFAMHPSFFPVLSKSDSYTLNFLHLAKRYLFLSRHSNAKCGSEKDLLKFLDKGLCIEEELKELRREVFLGYS